jgi:hypothetical protein
LADLRVGRKGRERIRTESLNLLGLMSKNTKQNAATSPAQSTTRPNNNRRNTVAGVRLPNALARRKRGKASETRVVWT